MNTNENVKASGKELKITDCSSGTEYMFVSYASKNKDSVYNKVLRPLQEIYGLKIFVDLKFDERNENWILQMDDNITNSHCQGVLMFVSQEYIQSHACLMEILRAINFGKEIVPIYIDNCRLASLKEGEVGQNHRLSPQTKQAMETTVGWIKENDSSASNVKGAKRAIQKFEEHLRQDKLTEYRLTAAFKELLKNSGFQNYTLSLYPDEAELKKLKLKIENINPGLFEYDGEEADNEADNETALDGEFNTAPADENGDADLEVEVQEVRETGTVSTGTVSVTGDITYMLYGKEYTHNQANMMLNVFAKVLKRHPEMVDKILADAEKPLIRCVSKINYELPENRNADMPSRYAQGCYFEVGSGIYVGTALNYKEKLRNISQLLEVCQEDISILQSEKIELPSVVTRRKSSHGNDEKYWIYGREYTGNQTQMMVDVLRYLVEKHFEKRSELVKLLSIKLSPLSELSDVSYFRTGKEFIYQNVTYSIGTSFGRNDKIKQIKKAIDICNEDMEQFEIEGLETAKPAARTSRNRSRTKQDFLNE